MKNILYIIESSETGGAEKIFLDLVLSIDRSRYNPHVALLYEGWLCDRFRERGIEPHMIQTGRGGFDIRLFNGIRSVIRNNGINIVHSHLFTTNVYASVCGALASIPVISTFHGTMDVNATDALKKLKWCAVNKFSRKIVFVSKYLQDYFVSRRMTSKSKSVVIYNGIDTGRFEHCITKVAARQALGLPMNCFIIGCVGDLRPAKDYLSALRATSQLKKNIPSLKLVIAGTKTGLIRDLLAAAYDLGISENVNFLDHRPDIENVFPAFDIYLSSSTSEGFSLTVAEAMAAGLPVVATRSGGPEEIISHGKTGMLVGIGKPDEIAKNIEIIFKDSSTAINIGEAGRRHVELNFCFEKMVDNYHDLYLCVAGANA